MFPISIIRFIGIVLMSVSAPVFACGQGAPCEPTEPGGKTTVRGYGYGYEGGSRPVTLVWIADGTTAARGEIDANGEFAIQVTPPMFPGLHKLVVRQGEGDLSPVEITVPVVLPASANSPIQWVRSFALNLTSPWLLGALGLALLAALAALGTRVQRRPQIAV